MPFLSRKQQAWGHTSAGMRALGGPAAVREWDAATELSLPEKKEDPPMKPKKFLQSAIQHPGALTKAASEHGVSKLQEAEKESHSKNPHIRGRGLLGIRLIRHKI